MIKKCNKCGWLSQMAHVRCGEHCWACSDGVYEDAGMTDEEFDGHQMRVARNRISRVLSAREGRVSP